MTNAFTSSGLFGDIFQDPAIASHFSASAFLGHAIAFEIAWTETLMSLGVVSDAAGRAALDALNRFEPDMTAMSSSSDVNGLPVPGFVKQLRQGLDDDVAKAIHTGTTSQDVIDTALVLCLTGVFDEFETRLETVLERLERIPGLDATMMGRTRMQAALPIPVSARVESWAGPLSDHLVRLGPLRTDLTRIQLGGPVGLRDVPGGQGEEAAALMAQKLGLRTGRVWHSDRSRVVDVGHWLTLVAGSLGKMGQDIALMAQQGVDEIKIAGGGGSSAMPHKANPVLAETLVTLARFVGAQQGALAQSMVHEQERSGIAWGLEWMVLPPMVEATGAALRHGAALLDQVERLGPLRGV